MLRAALSLAVYAALCATPSHLLAQKGVGEESGVARQQMKLELTEVTGEIRALKTGPCENTTGRAAIGTHVLLKAADGRELNVHLGPEAAVRHVAERLTVGQTVTLQAFRTEKMQEGHFVARSLVLGDETVELRDETLRPVWAGAAIWGGRVGYARGFGYGLGYGRGGTAGPGWGTCPAWGGPPPGHGPGWARPALGPGWGGYGWGHGRATRGGRRAAF